LRSVHNAPELTLPVARLRLCRKLTGMTDPELVAKKLAFIETCIRER
jgi:hypothetical protein